VVSVMVPVVPIVPVVPAVPIPVVSDIAAMPVVSATF
jgi:hypothetical protein